MIPDTFGLPVSTQNAVALDSYLLAVDRLLAGVGDPLAAADDALARDEGLALAHSARATALMLAGRFVDAQAAAATAVGLAAGTTRREQQHVAIIHDVVSGRRDFALRKTQEHIADFPGDALAIDPASGVFGVIGFSGRRDREAEQLALLQPLAARYGGHWWYQRVLGFALLENDAAEQARPLVETALAARPDSGHVAHTWVHVLFEAGEHKQAGEWLSEWAPGYASDGLLYCHLWWHAALLHLLAADFDAMWRTYDDHCLADQSTSPAINVFTDGVSLVWRAMVAGLPIATTRMRELHAFGEASFARPGIFVDVHWAACLAALGESTAIKQFRRQCSRALEQGKLAAGPVVLQIIDGFEAFANDDWLRATTCLEPALADVVRIGGSRAQRRLVVETLAVAQQRLAE